MSGTTARRLSGSNGGFHSPVRPVSRCSPTAARDQGSCLVDQQGVVLPAHPVEHDDVAGRFLLQQGSDRCDPYSLGDQERTGPCSAQRGECAVRPLDDRAAPDRDVPRVGAGAADRLGGQAHLITPHPAVVPAAVAGYVE
jgi:hypothetical protein